MEVWEHPDFWLEFEALDENHRQLMASMESSLRVIEQCPVDQGEALIKAWVEFGRSTAKLVEIAEAVAMLQATGCGSPMERPIGVAADALRDGVPAPPETRA